MSRFHPFSLGSWGNRFALLFALNHLNLSLVAPASASLTLVTNAIAGKFFLKENVDRRRWTAAVLVCIGVYLLAH